MKLRICLTLLVLTLIACTGAPEAEQETAPPTQAESGDRQAGAAATQVPIEPDVQPTCPLPRVTIDGICCFDANRNGICDDEETDEVESGAETEQTSDDDEPAEALVDQVEIFLDALELTEGDFREFPETLRDERDTILIVGNTGSTVAAAINLQLWLLGEGVQVADSRPPAETYDAVVLDFRNNLIIIGDCSHPYGFCEELSGDAELRYYKLGNRAVITILGDEEVDANAAVDALINGDLSLRGHVITR